MAKKHARRVLTPPGPDDTAGPAPADLEAATTRHAIYLAELEEIAARHEGLLRPEDVVEYARDPATALHARFEWNNSKAAHAYRLFQARQFIRVSVRQLATAQVRAFVSLTPQRVQVGGGYETTLAVMRDAEKREQLLLDALGELQGFRRKYLQLRELGEVFAAIDRLMPPTQTAA